MVDAGVASAVLVPVTVVPADQVYVVPPPAVRLAVWPAQIDGELTVTAGNAFTVTVETAVLEQPDAVPVTVYDVVDAGDASAVLVPVTVVPLVQV